MSWMADVRAGPMAAAMNDGRGRRRFAAVAAIALIAGCAADGGLKPEAALVDPASLRLSGKPDASGEAGWPAADWWRRFGDAQLDRLVAEAISGSPGIRVAQARVRRALHLAQSVAAASEPSIALNGGVERQRLTERGMIPPAFAGRTVNTARVALDFQYSFDFWDRNRSLFEAAIGEARAAAADAAAARLVLQAAVASSYFGLQRSVEQAAIARERVSRLEDLRRLARERFERGLDSELELSAAHGTVASAQRDLAALETEQSLWRNQLAALLGKGPEAAETIVATSLRVPDAIGLPPNLPADLVGRRPDIVAQRQRVEAAAAAIGAAKAQFFPDINLLAFAGLQSVGLGNLIDAASRVLSVGPALHLPLFNAGSLRAGLGARNAEFDVAAEQYNRSVIEAMREVGDAIAAMKSADRQLAEQRRAIDAARRGHELAQSRLRHGLAGSLPVLGAEVARLAQRERDAMLREQQLRASLSLFIALGGGYRAESPS